MGRRSGSLWTLVLGLLLVVSATVGPFGAGAAPARATAPAAAYVRVGHLVPGFAAVTMAATLSSYSGKATPLTLTPSASYGSIGAYRAVPVGFYSLAVRPVGASPASPPVLSGTLQAQPGAAYTVVGIGTASSPKVAVIQDDLSHPAPGTSRVRVVNAAVPGQTASLTAAGNPVASSVAFATATGYTGVPAGTWTMDATAGDRTDAMSVSLAAGDVYTLLLLDNGQGGLTVRPVTDAAGPATAPVGGAATGRGGLARAPLSAPMSLPLATAGGVLLVGGAGGLLLTRRRPVAGRRSGPARHASGPRTQA